MYLILSIITIFRFLDLDPPLSGRHLLRKCCCAGGSAVRNIVLSTVFGSGCKDRDLVTTREHNKKKEINYLFIAQQRAIVLKEVKQVTIIMFFRLK